MADDDKNRAADAARVNEASTGYSAEYVKTLRDENAGWRTKLRETETELTTLRDIQAGEKLDATIGVELTKRGVEANPAWVDLTEGQTIPQAVDAFLVKYPSIAAVRQEEVNEPAPRSTHKPMGTQKQNTNVQTGAVSDIAAIRKDPVARAKLRDIYRGMLNLNTGKHL